MKLGISLLLLTLGLFLYEYIYPAGCAYCFWQRTILGAIGILFIASGRYKDSKLLTLSIMIISIAGVLIAWEHLELYFKQQVMHLSQLMQVYGQAGADQKAIVRSAIEDNMTLRWALKAMPLWSMGLFGSIGLYSLVLIFLRRSS